jgi:hypothetical protein
MNFSARKFLRLLCVSFALLVVTGDLIADAVHNASSSCVTESQSGEHDSCPDCGCTLHTGNALAIVSVPAIIPDNGNGAAVPEMVQRCSIGSPLAIDHPPQLG